MLISFSDKIIELRGEEIFSHMQNSFTNRVVTYIINSAYRKSVTLVSWINEQVNNPNPELVNAEAMIPDGKNHDETMQNILIWVRSNIKYVSDDSVWKMPEYWQRADETLKLKTGDCEDGAILMYVLARLKGIPTNRLLLFAGDVEGGGHCWLGYKPKNYPMNFVFMDWCYWVDLSSVKDRKKFYINNKDIHEYFNDGTEKKTKYYRIWFGFNEEKSYTGMIYNFQ